MKPAPASPVGGVGPELGPEAPLDAGRGHRARCWPRSRARLAFTCQPPCWPRPSPPLPQAPPLLLAAPHSLLLHSPVPPRPMTPPLPVSLPLPQAPPPPSLLGAAGPGVWRCQSRARPGSAATATAIAGSSSPSTGEGWGRRGARGLASPGPAAAAPAGAPGLARGGWGRRGRCPVPGRPEGVRPSPSRRGGGPGTGEVPAREARRRLGRLGARGDGRRG